MSNYEELRLDPGDRILIFAPHPDDETIATGGVIQKAVAMGLPIHLVYFTYGDNNETSFIVYRKRPVAPGKAVQQMGLVRHGEGLAATGVLGLRLDQVTFLGYPDFRCLAIWTEHWGDCAACESMFTHTNKVPYPNALRPGVPYKGEEVLADVEQMLCDFAAAHGAPTKVFVSHPGDHNPDHLALYLFVRVALLNLRSQMQPALIPFLVHHPEWPLPAGYNPKLTLEPPARLQNESGWLVNRLSPEQVERKRAALQKHQTQYKVSGAYLDSFMRANELFGDLPSRPLQKGSMEAFHATGPDAPATIPPELTAGERAKWVGVERRAVWLEGDQVVIAVEFTGRLGDDVCVPSNCCMLIVGRTHGAGANIAALIAAGGAQFTPGSAHIHFGGPSLFEAAHAAVARPDKKTGGRHVKTSKTGDAGRGRHRGYHRSRCRDGGRGSPSPGSEVPAASIRATTGGRGAKRGRPAADAGCPRAGLPAGPGRRAGATTGRAAARSSAYVTAGDASRGQ